MVSKSSALDLDADECVSSFVLKIFLDREGVKILKKVFEACTKDDKKDNETIKDYFFRKGLTEIDYERCFNPVYRKKLESGSDEEFDMSLWICLLKKLPTLCDVLRNKWDAEGTKETLESCLQELKTIRNDDLCHNRMSISRKWRNEIFRKIKESLLKAWELTGKRFCITDISDAQISVLNGITFQHYAKDILPLKSFATKKSKTLLTAYSLVSLSPGKRVKMTDIFTYPEFESAHESSTNSFEDLLKNANGQFTLIEGPSGTGKTAILRFIVADWIADDERPSFTDHDLIIPINFKKEVEDFPATLADIARYLLPDNFSLFENLKDWKKWLLKLKILVLIDDLDMFENYEQLLKDIQENKADQNITIIGTCRSEKVGYIRGILPVHTNFFKLKGLKSSTQDSLVKHYCKALQREGNEQDVLYFLKRTSPVLGVQWKLPQSLSTWTVLVALNPETEPYVTTFEAFSRLHQVKMENLFKRLVTYRLLSGSDCDSQTSKSSQLTFFICKESLNGLEEKSLVLNENAVKNITDCCQSLKLPSDAVFGTFFVPKFCTAGGNNEKITWEYQSEDQRLFFAAKGIYDWYSGKQKLSDVVSIRNSMIKIFEEHKVPVHKFNTIIKAIPERVFHAYSLSYSECIEKLRTMDMLKRQRLLTHLSGLFHKKGRKVNPLVVRETIEQLMACSDLNNKDWIRVFNNIHFNENVLRLVFETRGILIGSELLGAINKEELISCGKRFRDACPHVDDFQKDLFRMPHFPDLLSSLIRQEICIKRDHLAYLYYHPNFLLKDTSIERAIVEWLSNSEHKEIKYMGPITPKLKIPSKVTCLKISISNDESYGNLKYLLKNRCKLLSLEQLCVCINVDKVDLPYPEPLPAPTRDCCWIFFPYVTDGTAAKAADMAIALHPGEITKVCFPRCKVTKEFVGRFLTPFKKKKKGALEIQLPSEYEDVVKESDHLHISFKRFRNCWK